MCHIFVAAKGSTVRNYISSLPRIIACTLHESVKAKHVDVLLSNIQALPCCFQCIVGWLRLVDWTTGLQLLF